MSAGFIVVVAILAFALVTVWKCVRIIPKVEEWIVERLGKYHGTLHHSLKLTIPELDSIDYSI